MIRKLFSLITVVSLIGVILTSCMESTHADLPTARIGGKKCVVINYPNEDTKIAVPIELYDIYAETFKKIGVVFENKVSPLGDASADIYSYREQVQNIDIIPFYNAISKLDNEYDMLSLKKFLVNVNKAIVELGDYNIGYQGTADYNKYLYNKCMIEDAIAAFTLVHNAFPSIDLHVNGIIVAGIDDMKNYTNIENYKNFSVDDLSITARAIERQITAFDKYQYLCTDEQLNEIFNIEQDFRTSFGLPAEATDGNGE